ncbi:MAG: plasmid replication protein RepC [Methylocystis sp.]
MTHAQISPTGRRPDFAASYHARKQSHAPLFTVTNKHLLKAAADAAQALALNPKERQVLTELALSFGGQQLAAGLLCWPSNAHLSARTNIPERTLSRILSGLCRQGLIVARESANGKRFPIKNRKGEIVDARGFDLTPLYTRAREFAERCREIDVEAKLCRQLRGDVTAARNAVRDLCAADGAGLLIKIAARLDALSNPLPRCATSRELAAAAEAFVTLADDARDILYAASESSEMTGCARQNGRHSEQETEFSIEDCKQDRSAATATPHSSQKGAYGAIEAFREKKGGIVRHNERSIVNAEKSVPKDLDLWRGACPELEHFEPVSSIEHAAATGAELLRACGLAQRGFDGAALSIGAVNAGLVALFVYQRHADGERPGGTPIRSPGGLFVSLTREIALGHNDLGRALTTMRQKRRVERRH